MSCGHDKFSSISETQGLECEGVNRSFRRGGLVPRVYVSNLAESVTRDDLRTLFSKVGRVRGALVITDRLTGKSKGFGFVEMADVDDAISAAGYFDGVELEGRKIHVDPYNHRVEPAADAYRGERKRRAPLKRSTSNGTG
jgi:RNA recognition motif-containing protein